VSTVLISGATGFIGSNLAESLAANGHRVARLARKRSRRPDASNTIIWDPEAGRIDRESLARLQPDAVINLAGEPIARRWTPDRRRRIRESRVRGTTALAEALATLPTKPGVLISGSAVGYYGAHRGDEILDEQSAPGSDFLAETARDWERATEAASRAGIRVVVIRTGLVLGNDGGLLDQMLPTFRLGLGGRLGHGRQWMSWIAMADVTAAIQFLMETQTMSGPVNLVAPEPARNTDFSKTLARVLRRPALFPVPAFALEAIFGTMADNTILASQRVAPKRLAGAGFEFRHPRLEEALRFVLRR
jgi:uncharacterized protein (TIGR01777 family)